MGWRAKVCADDARGAVSRPYSVQLAGALGAGADTRSKFSAGKLGSCGRQSDRVMEDESNGGDIAGGPRVVV